MSTKEKLRKIQKSTKENVKENIEVNKGKNNENTNVKGKLMKI